jgi:hypothetical protein
MSIVTDTRDYASHFVQSDVKGKKALYGIKQDKITDVTK